MIIKRNQLVRICKTFTKIKLVIVMLLKEIVSRIAKLFHQILPFEVIFVCSFNTYLN